VVARLSRAARYVLPRFEKETTKSPFEHHSRNEASKHNESGKTGIHFELINAQ
jgi:hypothetical protein